MAETARPGAVIAGAGIRLLAASYDLLILLSITLVVVAIPITIGNAVFGAKPPHWLQNLLFVAVAYAYFVGFWRKGGQTTGMRPWKLRVAMVGSGDYPNLLAASVRFLGMMISWLAFVLIILYIYALNANNVEVFNQLFGALPKPLLVPGFLAIAMIPAMNLLLMIMTQNKQTLYDLAAGTSIYRVE